MKLAVTLFSLLFFVLFGLNAGATEVSAKGQLILSSPGYFSGVDADFKVLYVNTSLPWGVKIEMHYGFERSEFESGTLVPRSNWVEMADTEMVSVSAYTWAAQIRKQMYARGSSSQLTALQFVAKITFADGSVAYDTGSANTMGYFQVSRPGQSQECMFSGSDCALSVQTK